MKKIVALAAISVVSAGAYAQSVVYDNTTHSLDNNFPLLPAWMNDSVEAGDEIWLDGTDREVTELKLLFTFRGTELGSFDARIRFHDYDYVEHQPGVTFYDSGITQGLTMDHGINEYSFAIPNVVVPDRFVWTVQVYNRQGEGEFGPSYFNPPTVGFSDDFFWQSGTGTDWTAYSWGADPFANFGARLTAVPEPTTLASLGCAFMLGMLKKRRRR